MDVFESGDAIVTRFADRGRDRHAREDEFQSYDHYLPQYWEYRTVRMKFVDRVASGGGTIDVSFVTEWRLTVAEFRAWYLGSDGGSYDYALVLWRPAGTFDDDHVQLSDGGGQYRYTYTITKAYEAACPSACRGTVDGVRDQPGAGRRPGAGRLLWHHPPV